MALNKPTPLFLFGISVIVVTIFGIVFTENCTVIVTETPCKFGPPGKWDETSQDALSIQYAYADINTVQYIACDKFGDSVITRSTTICSSVWETAINTLGGFFQTCQTKLIEYKKRCDFIDPDCPTCEHLICKSKRSELVTTCTWIWENAKIL